MRTQIEANPRCLVLVLGMVEKGKRVVALVANHCAGSSRIGRRGCHNDNASVMRIGPWRGEPVCCEEVDEAFVVVTCAAELKLQR